MKKTLAILLSALMVLSLSAVAVYADGPAPVATAADFAAMTADGNYQLTADIEISASYAGAFTGTFDGNGHKITTTAPLFEDLGGTVKNLTINGTIAGATDANVAAVAAMSTAGCTVENVINNANVTADAASLGGYEAGVYGSGFVAYVKAASTFTNCVNNGSVTSTTTHVSGFVGFADNVDLTFTGCTNNGEVKNETVKTRTGGFVGVDGKNNSGKTFTITLTNCKNTANITGGDQVGGLVGWTMYNVIVTGCENTGNVVSTLNYAAGLVSRPGDDKCKTLAGCAASVFTNCKNSGNVTSAAGQASGIASYICTPVEFYNCKNSGNITCVVDSTSGWAAGIAGKAAVGAGEHWIICENCENTGNITGGDGAAGIAGNVGVKDNNTTGKTYVFTNCKNSGKISGTKNRAAGIVGYIYGQDGKNQYGVLTGCVNTGDLYSSTGYVSQFIAYTNSALTKIKDCIGAGTYNKIAETDTPYMVILGCSSANGGTVDGNKVPPEYDFSGNILIENSGVEYMSYATGDNSFNQVTLDAWITAHPGSFVIKTAAEIDAILNPPTTNPTTGDATVWFAIAGAVALLGTAVVLKARKA